MCGNPVRIPDAFKDRQDWRFIVRFTCPGLKTQEHSWTPAELAAVKPGAEGLRLLGEWAIEAKEWRKALDWLAEAYAQRPDRFAVRWSYGRALTKCSKDFKQPDVQIAVVKAIIAEDESSYLQRVDVLDSLAAAYEFKKDWPQAKEWNDRILAVEPGNGGARSRDQRIRKALEPAAVTQP